MYAPSFWNGPSKNREKALPIAVPENKYRIIASRSDYKVFAENRKRTAGDHRKDGTAGHPRKSNRTYLTAAHIYLMLLHEPNSAIQ